jgi:phytanoyl-CoA hydroxylase
MSRENNFFNISSPDGREIAIPVEVDETSDPYLNLINESAIRDYYDREGYVVFRNLIPSELCDQARLAFEQEVKPYKGYMYRQTTSGSPEKHIFTESGYVLNSILNIQDLNIETFPQFQEISLSIITHSKMYDAVKTILGEPGKLVQSMYFEGNPSTWAHQDTYYLDSTKVGEMTAAWIAIEDIQPGAGRFYIYPGSHKIDVVKNRGNFDIAFNHYQYKSFILNAIKKYGLECRAPVMRKGDVLFWSAKTIHGSLETRQPAYSRCSFTAHFIHESAGFLQFQSIEKPLKLRKVNSFYVHCPKDQSNIKNRAVFQVETRFPKLFKFVKSSAIKLLLR